MRRKVAAICASAMALAWGGSALAGDTSHSGQESHPEQGQQGATQSQSGAQGEQSASAEQSGAGEASASSANKQSIKAAQQQLKERGFYDGKVDGIAGPKTQAAISEFQRQNGISESGELDSATLAAMDIDESQIEPVAGSDEPSGMGQQYQQGTQQAAPGGEQRGAQQGRMTGGQQQGTMQAAVGTETFQLSALGEQQVRELQQKLRDQGLYRGEVDGIVGPQTRGALQQFYTRQAQLAGRGMITEQAANQFGIDLSAAQPVRGTEQGTQQPSQQRQQGPQHQQQQQQQQPSGSQSPGMQSPGMQSPGTESPTQPQQGQPSQGTQPSPEQQRIPERTPEQPEE